MSPDLGRGWAAWTRCWGAVATLGACVGLLMWSPTTVLWTAVVAAAVGAAAEMLHRPATHGAAPLAFRPPRLRTAWFALLSALGVVAARVVGELWPAGLLIALLLAGLTTPVVVGWVRKQVGAAEQPASQRVSAHQGWSGGWSADSTKAAQLMSDAELCFTWRRSFQALLDASTPAQRQAVVAVRQACLDELERRNPLALSAWLESGPTPAGGPERFLVRRDDGEAA
jgi:hypothetical protein